MAELLLILGFLAAGVFALVLDGRRRRKARWHEYQRERPEPVSNADDVQRSLTERRW